MNITERVDRLTRALERLRLRYDRLVGRVDDHGRRLDRLELRLMLYAMGGATVGTILGNAGSAAAMTLRGGDMEIFDPEDIGGFIGVLAELWQTSGRVGPIIAIALGVIGSVWLARRQLTARIPWLATRHGALFLVALFAVGNSAGLAALEGETSILAILIQAGAAAVTAIGLRSGTKAATTGGAAEMEAWTEDGEKVLVRRHEHVRPPRDSGQVASEEELARIIREEGKPRR